MKVVGTRSELRAELASALEDHVEVGLDLDRRGGDTEPARDLQAFTIEARQQEPVQVARRQIVVNLERQGALARAHCSETEPKRCHREP